MAPLLAALCFSPATFGAEPPAPLAFQSPDKGFVSMGVYNDRGELIRNLLNASPAEAGKQTVAWDGTTNLGLPAAPGDYHVRGVWFSEPPQIKYVMKVGLSGEPPYMTDDPNSGWGACHGPAAAICTNGKNLFTIFRTAESPRETGVQLMDFGGNIVSRFSTFFPFDSRLACTMDDKNIYLAAGHSSYGTKGLVIGKYDIDNPPRGKILCEIPVPDHFGTKGYLAGHWLVDVQGLAVQNGRLYVPVLLDDKVYVIDSTSGKILDTASVASPRGVAAFRGTVYAISGTTLVRLDADGNPDKGQPVISGLDDPSGLAVDAGGNFYISDGGASQQVKVFTPAGKPLREIGIKGGRPRDGIYNPAGMLDPHGLCVAPDGKVWVAEIADDYQILGAWNPDGTRAKSFYNTHWASGEGRLSPDRKEMLFSARDGTSNAGLTSYKVDMKNGTWAPYWHLNVAVEAMDQKDVLLGWNPSTPREQAMFDHHMVYLSFEKDMVQGTNGRTYLVGGEGSIYLFDQETKKAKLTALVFTHHVEKTAAGPYQASYDQGKPNWLAWSDVKGDGKISMDGVRYVENPPQLDGGAKVGGFQLMPDLSIMMLIPLKPKGVTTMTWSMFRLKPEKVSESGVPVYDWKDIEKVTDLKIPDLNGGDHDPGREVTHVGVGFMHVVGDSVYVRLEPGPKVKQRLTGIDGDSWWASRNWRITPEKFDLKTGEPAWLKLGRRTPGHANPGEMYYPGWGVAGPSHGVIFLADTLSQVWAWTDDGLYLGHLYNDNVGHSTYDPNSVFVELIGTFVYDIDGKTYILTGDHGVSVHEVEFPTMTSIDAGTVKLTSEQVAQAKPWDPDGPAPGKRPTYVARSIYDFEKNAQKATRTITIDGKLDPAEWNDVPAMPLILDGKNVGTVRLTFDNENLYLAYEVQDSNGLKNDGHELPYAPFVSGAYVDFDIGPDWAMRDRDKNLEGDVRVIMARIKATNDYQMGFWPVKQEFKKYAPLLKLSHPQTIVSPVAQRHFDDVVPVDGLTFAYQITAGGYTLEAKVPFASLGINPTKQPIVGFDASVAFSDAGGESRTRAIHWAGESEAAVVDRPGSAELKPATWGTLQFDRTPLAPVAADAVVK
ncbi:MAG: sugar-binding protein [Chthoniobacteraceae bacterium]